MEEGGFIERKETYDEINNNQSSGNSPWPAAEEGGREGREGREGEWKAEMDQIMFFSSH